MSDRPRSDEPYQEPTASDLAAIEREMPLIEAEMTLLDAEIALLASGPVSSEVDWQRLRRAQRRVFRERAAQLAAARVRPPSERQVA